VIPPYRPQLATLVQTPLPPSAASDQYLVEWKADGTRPVNRVDALAAFRP